MDKRSDKDKVCVTWLTDRINPGISPTKLIGIYDDICSNYDTHSAVLDYGGPSTAAEEIANMVAEKQRQQVRVLDIAAGTGLVGCQLHKRGFTNIDALEPSEGMMKILTNTGVYTRKYQEFVGIGQSTVPKDTYDVVVACGSFAPGHIKVEGISDLINVAKPGGLVVIIMRLECFLTDDEYKEKMENYMDRLEKTHVWRKEVKKTVPNYFDGKEGMLLIYRVL